ncbi:hypothetical protein O3M35_002963 [Rhynocoris fuscipes]|uniref:Uncharacterized protein n=1 Tax=Rhynocoris fuscipes TaxID=488301 RepID=A0AAW1CIF4_9HEMI
MQQQNLCQKKKPPTFLGSLKLRFDNFTRNYPRHFFRSLIMFMISIRLCRELKGVILLRPVC